MKIRIIIATKICILFFSGIGIFSCNAWGLYDTMTGTPTGDPVSDMLPKINYNSVNYMMTQGVAIMPITPTITGGIMGCLPVPALPTGLSIDATTCAISGTPTATQATTNHIITATNVYGSGQATISITVPLRALLQFDFTGGSLVNSGSLAISLGVQEWAPTMTIGKDGDTNGAYLYTTNNQYFTTASVAGLPVGASPRTMCAWVNPSVLPAVGVHHMAIRYGDITTANASVLGISNIAGVQKVSFIGGSYDAYADYSVPINTWSHLCATFNGSTASLYVNGTFIASPAFTGTGPLNTTSTSFVIGTWWGSGDPQGYYWRGVLDDVRIYDTALSATQIGQIHGDGMTY